MPIEPDAEALREQERIVRWIDQAIERAKRHGNTEGIWLFASQWLTVRAALTRAPVQPSQGEDYNGHTPNRYVPPMPEGASLFAVEPQTGAWHYINHAGTWQGMPSPLSAAPSQRDCAGVVDLAADVLRAMNGRTCRDVAPEIGISSATLNRVTRGHTPDLPTYFALCRWLNIPADLRDMDGKWLGALHRLQHERAPAAKPKLGGSIIQWAGEEIAALRAALDRLPAAQGEANTSAERVSETAESEHTNPPAIPAGMVAYGPKHPDYPNEPKDWNQGPVRYRDGLTGNGSEVAYRNIQWRHSERWPVSDVVAYTPTDPPARMDVAGEDVLSDPTAVHLNMLRGGIARPTPANIWHLYGRELLDAMPATFASEQHAAGVKAGLLQAAGIVDCHGMTWGLAYRSMTDELSRAIRKQQEQVA